MKFLHELFLSLIPSAFAEYAGEYYNYGSSYNLEWSAFPSLISLFAPLAILGSLFGIVCHLVAKKKGYSGYFWTGFFFLMFGAVYVAALPIATQEPGSDHSADVSPEDRNLLSSFHRLSAEDQKIIMSHIHSFLIEK